MGDDDLGHRRLGPEDAREVNAVRQPPAVKRSLATTEFHRAHHAAGRVVDLEFFSNPVGLSSRMVALLPNGFGLTSIRAGTGAGVGVTHSEMPTGPEIVAFAATSCTGASRLGPHTPVFSQPWYESGLVASR